MKSLLILGVGGSENNGGVLSLHENVGVVEVTDDQFQRLMHINNHQEMTNKLKEEFDEFQSYELNDAFGRQNTLKSIIKYSKNPLEIINARRELSHLNFGCSKRKNTKKRG